VRTADVVDTAIACNGGNYLNAHLFVIIEQQPQLPGKVEIAQNVNAVWSFGFYFRSAYQPEKAFAGDFIPILFVALKTWRLNRDNRDSLFVFHLPANGLYIVAYYTNYAG
jgi:hypothetical protein